MTKSIANGTANPFTPTFGLVPDQLAGRDRLPADMGEAFANGVGDPNPSTILVGARGSGKTALLSCIADEAQQRGWVAVNVLPGEGMLEDVLQRTAEAAAEFLDAPTQRRLSGLTLGQAIGLEWTSETGPEPNWRGRMNALLDGLTSHEKGLLVTVDEVRASSNEPIKLVGTYQLFVREGRRAALVMAGLPSNVSALVSNKDVSFLRRGRQHYLGRIADAEIAHAFRLTVENAGKTIDDDGFARRLPPSAAFHT